MVEPQYKFPCGREAATSFATNHDKQNLIIFSKTLHHINKLDALRECRPPWPRQIITSILPTVKMLSLGGERLTPKVLDHYLHCNLVMLQLLWCIFAHLLILDNLDHHQNLMFFIVPSRPLHTISAQSIQNFLSNVVHKQTNKQTNQRYQKHNLLLPRR